jgi:hypothetical protein
MAVGIGFLVGLSVRKFGKGSSATFGITGAVLALLGCVLGNLFAAYDFVAESEHMTMLAVMSALSPGATLQLMIDSFSGMDLLFYAIAVYEGFKLSMVPEK